MSLGKIFIIGAIVLTAAAAAIGYMNRNQFAETTKDLLVTNVTLAKTEKDLSETKKKLRETEENLAAMTADRDQWRTKAEQLESDLGKARAQIEELNAQITAKDGEIANLKAENETKTKRLAELEGDIAGTGGKLAELNNELQATKTELENVKGILTIAQDKVSNLSKEKEDRQKRVMRNGVEGKILAVNPAWNFVVLNLGDKNGLASNIEMLIKRGGQMIGKVRVTSVEPSTAVADIVANSVPPGFSIQPGDHVIYQELLHD